MKTFEEITIENENLKRGNVKVWEQLEKSTEILSHHEAYISLLEEENAQLKELLNECKQWFDWYHIDTGAGKEYIESWHKKGREIHQKINQALGEE